MTISFWNFLVDESVVFGDELALLLLHGWIVWVCLELMNHLLWVNSSHFCVRPGKAIMVLHKTFDEVLTEVWLQMSSDLNLMVQ